MERRNQLSDHIDMEILQQQKATSKTPRDKERSVANLLDMFGDRFDADVVSLILEECDWDEENTIEKLFELCSERPQTKPKSSTQGLGLDLIACTLLEPDSDSNNQTDNQHGDPQQEPVESRTGRGHSFVQQKPVESSGSPALSQSQQKPVEINLGPRKQKKKSAERNTGSGVSKPMPMDSDMMNTNFSKRTSSGPVYDYQALLSSFPGPTNNSSLLDNFEFDHNSYFNYNPEPSTCSEDLTSAITNPLEPQPGQGVLDSTKDNWYHEFAMSSQLSSGIQDKRSVLGASVLRAEGLTVQSGSQFSSPAAGSKVNSISSSTNIPPGLPMPLPLSTTSRPVATAGIESYSQAMSRPSKWSLVTEELDPLPSSSSKTQQCSVWHRSQCSTISPPMPVSSASVRSLSPWALEFQPQNTPTTGNCGTGGTLLPSAFQSGDLSGRSSAEHSHYQASTSSIHSYSSPDLMSAASPPSPSSSVTAEQAAWWSAKVGGVLGSSSSAGQTAKVGGVLGSSSSAGQTAKVGGVLGSSSSAGQTANVGGVLGSSSSAMDITRLRGGMSITELGPDNSKVMVIMRGLPGSGKSTLARLLQGRGQIFSTDDFFLNGGAYQFRPEKLSEAHEWNQRRVRTALEDRVTPVIVDNTNCEVWEMMPYVEMAVLRNYRIDVREPNTPWKNQLHKLADMNAHGVRIDSIKRMKNRFERIRPEDLVKLAEKRIRAKGMHKTDSRTKLLPAQGVVKNQPQLNSKLAKGKSVKKPAPVHQTSTKRKSPEELLKSMLLNVKDHCSMMQEEGARPEEVEAMIFMANLKPHQEQAINQYLTMVKNGSNHDGKADRMFDQFIQDEIAAKSSSLENASIDRNSNKSLVKETGGKTSSKESSSSRTASFDKNSNKQNKTDCSGIHNKSSKQPGRVDADSRAGLNMTSSAQDQGWSASQPQRRRRRNSSQSQQAGKLKFTPSTIAESPDAATNSAAASIAGNKDGGTKQANAERKSNTAVSSNITTENKGGEDSIVTDWVKSLPQREGKGKETSLPSGGTDRLQQQQVRPNSSEVCTFKSAGREEGGGDEASALMTGHEAEQSAKASEETSSVDSGITQDTVDSGQTQGTAADSGENEDTADKTKPQENVDSKNAQETVESITIQDIADSGKTQDTADKEKIQDNDDNEEKQDTVDNDSIKTQDIEGSSKNQDTAEVEKTQDIADNEKSSEEEQQENTEMPQADAVAETEETRKTPETERAEISEENHSADTSSVTEEKLESSADSSVVANCDSDNCEVWEEARESLDEDTVAVPSAGAGDDETDNLVVEGEDREDREEAAVASVEVAGSVGSLTVRELLALASDSAATDNQIGDKALDNSAVSVTELDTANESQFDDEALDNNAVSVTELDTANESQVGDEALNNSAVLVTELDTANESQVGDKALDNSAVLVTDTANESHIGDEALDNSAVLVTELDTANESHVGDETLDNSAVSMNEMYTTAPTKSGDDSLTPINSPMPDDAPSLALDLESAEERSTSQSQAELFVSNDDDEDQETDRPPMSSTNHSRSASPTRHDDTVYWSDAEPNSILDRSLSPVVVNTALFSEDSSAPASPVAQKARRRKKHRAQPAPFLEDCVVAHLSSDSWKNFEPEKQISATTGEEMTGEGLSGYHNRVRLNSSAENYSAEIGTQTEGKDFGVALKGMAQDDGGYVFLQPNSQYQCCDKAEPMMTSTMTGPRHLAKKTTLDKSSNVDMAEPTLVSELYSLFPDVACGHLTEVLDVCNGNVDFAIELLLDWGVTTPITPHDRKHLARKTTTTAVMTQASTIQISGTGQSNDAKVGMVRSLQDTCIEVMMRCGYSLANIQRYLISSGEQRLDRIETSTYLRLRSFSTEPKTPQSHSQSSSALHLPAGFSVSDFTAGAAAPDEDLPKMWSSGSSSSSDPGSSSELPAEDSSGGKKLMTTTTADSKEEDSDDEIYYFRNCDSFPCNYRFKHRHAPEPQEQEEKPALSPVMPASAMAQPVSQGDLTVTLPSALVSNLETLFGALPAATTASKGPVTVQLDHVAAHTLYQCLVHSLGGSQASSEEERLRQLKEDEALAHFLQGEEEVDRTLQSIKESSSAQLPPIPESRIEVRAERVHGAKGRRLHQRGMKSHGVHKPEKDHGVVRKPVQLRDIIEEELANQRRKKQQAKEAEATGDHIAIATRLKREKLRRHFPGLDESFLEEIFQANGYCLETSVQVITFVLGESEKQPVPDVLEMAPAKEILDEEEITIEAVKQLSLQASKKRALYDAEEVRRQEHDYEDLRHDALLHHYMRRECFQKASDAHRKGMSDVASFYSSKGHDHYEKMKAANMRASETLLEIRHVRLQQEHVLDLHGFHVDEALAALKKVIAQKEEEFQQKPVYSRRYVHVITGRGRHSEKGQPRLRPAVMAHLMQTEHRYTEDTPGHFKVYLRPYC